MTDLLTRIAGTVDRYGMVRPGQQVGVAVSGGADSVCLLHCLLLLAPRWDLRLHVLHLDHHLRGEESRQDAEFVRRVAAELGLPVTVGQADPGSSAENLEQAARQARLAFFREAVAAGTVDRVALGHTRSDQAETVLFRFLRGSGSAGLAGIRPVTRDGLIRPLIEIDRADVEQFLRARSLPWREDSSNASERFARNRIRHRLMPLLVREWNPAMARTLAHTADWAEAEESYWEEELDRLSAGRLLERDGAVLLHAPSLATLPKAAARRLIRRAMERAKGDLRGVDFDHVEQVLHMAAGEQGHGHVAIPGLEAVRSFEWLRLARRSGARPAVPYCMPAVVPGTIWPPGSALAISLELIEKPETFEGWESVYNSGMGCLDWRHLSSPLELRSWKPGDRYQPSGSSGIEKIKTLFQRARIPVWERRGWPVLWGGEAIVWARRFGPSALVAADSSSSIILRVRELEAR
ncbi:MAG: tRNA lysidine(34) synthetase TilS [Candidatus Sulfopaludibacter sp.]|nr:tRNA lysidine(34) synthetase TilS [Candidatus Sulfopaludibacter sp.]